MEERDVLFFGEKKHLKRSKFFPAGSGLWMEKREVLGFFWGGVGGKCLKQCKFLQGGGLPVTGPLRGCGVGKDPRGGTAARGGGGGGGCRTTSPSMPRAALRNPALERGGVVVVVVPERACALRSGAGAPWREAAKLKASRPAAVYAAVGQ